MEIDFVVTWVDGSDPKWIAKYNKYSPNPRDTAIDARGERYEDGGLLRYWFRGVEKYAPWVRKIFFITDGQKPEWLNLDNKKLVWVKHEDFIPAEYLPTFSSRPIEMHIHKIKEISDRFVYFNDDFYLINPVTPKFYFRNNLPVDFAIINTLSPTYYGHTLLNNIIEVNKHFNQKKVIKKDFKKWFYFKYKLIDLARAALYGRRGEFIGLKVNHCSQAYLKKTFDIVWDSCKDVLERTCKNKFRTVLDVSIYIFRNWQLATGQFTPSNLFKYRDHFQLTQKNMPAIKSALTSNRLTEVCLNSSDESQPLFKEIIEIFDKKFPEKSSFEI